MLKELLYSYRRVICNLNVQLEILSDFVCWFCAFLIGLLLYIYL